MDDLDSNFSEEDYGGEYVNSSDEHNERDEMETIHEQYRNKRPEELILIRKKALINQNHRTGHMIKLWV